MAESLLLKHQLLILNRTRTRAPALQPTDRVVAGLCAILIRPTRLVRSAIVLKPSTILRFHKALVKRKYRLLFTQLNGRKRGPKGPSRELISAIVEMKYRNPRFGYQRIADQISLTFDVDLDKDVVRRVLAKHYRSKPGSNGPSWLTFLGHTNDSLWSVDLFRCESLILKSHWVMVIMDQSTRRIIGFAAYGGTVDRAMACRMFNKIISAAYSNPRYLSSDYDPLFTYHQWRANLRILQVTEVKTAPYVPLSHPFIERLIRAVRREFLDHVPFWGSHDLERKLVRFRDYYKEQRCHRGLEGKPPAVNIGSINNNITELNNYRWKRCCRGSYQLPIAA